MEVELVASETLMKGLNSQQVAAVSLDYGSALIVAGAGSGKTTVLTRRIAYLISKLKQDPHSILAVTFTNKAAAEMASRIEHVLGSKIARSLWIGTFHSICARLLRYEIESYLSPEGWRWKPNFVIYDETDSLNLIKSVIARLNLDEKVFAPREVRQKISSLKNDGYNQTDFRNDAKSYKDIRLSEIFTAYQSDLARNNALDFDDLILTFANLLKQQPEVLKRQQERFRHILVDEFQDTNQSQYKLITLLSSPLRQVEAKETSLLVVGDVDQSIYSWRKADYRIILGFQNDFKAAQLIKLEENYRSTSTILEVANSIIKNNSQRIEKVLRCNRGIGSKAQCYEAIDENEEAYYVIEQLKKMAKQGKSLSNTAVLYRTNSQSRALEEVLVRSHIPYTLVGATRFYERQEIKDILAYLKLIYNSADGQSFLRIVNTPRRGLGKTTTDRLVGFCEKNNLSPLEALQMASVIPELSSKAAKTLMAFANMIERWQTLASSISVSKLLEVVLSESGYLTHLSEESGDPVSEGRIENLQELVNVAREFDSMADEPTLEGFLTRVSLVSDIDKLNFGQETVKLMTLHSAKGLEFSTVFLVGLEEGLFPHVRSLDSPSALEEERRLMYVGVTRAQDMLYLSYARTRRVVGGPAFGTNYMIPSRFLKEISSHLVQGFYPSPQTDILSKSTPYASASWQGSPSGQHTKDPARAKDSFAAVRSSNDSRAPARIIGHQLPSTSAGAVQPIQAPDSNLGFEHLLVGDKVQHAKFGIGVVLQVIGEAGKQLLNVDFAANGKRLLDPRFAKLVKLN